MLLTFEVGNVVGILDRIVSILISPMLEPDTLALALLMTSSITHSSNRHILIFNKLINDIFIILYVYINADICT